MTAASMGVAALARAVRTRLVSAREVTEAALARIDAANTALGAFTAVTADRALAEAARVDAAVARGDDPGPLAGVPYAVKNLFDVAGLPTLAGSKINRDRKPAAFDATLVSRLRQAGALLTGTLNMGEFAYDFTGENAHYGPSRNPHDPSRMTGGSSGGSGSAVAAGLVPTALGSDTNGSIRVPASFCGLFGIKPTFGRLSRAGTFAFCPALDHVGPFARSVEDLALVYDAVQGADPDDPACSAGGVEPVTAALGGGIADIRLAVADDYFATDGLPEAAAAMALASDALGVHRRITIPQAARARAAAYIITNTESSALHLETLRTRADDYDPAVRDRMLAGALLPAAWYVQAQRFRHWYAGQCEHLFDALDVVLAPATPCPAPPIGQKTMLLRGEEMLVRPNIGVFTQPISFAGLPVVAVPMATDGPLPMGIQVIAAPWREDHAFRVAAALESAGVTRATVAPSGSLSP